eukprot:12411027-Karenia_brevis.AAC.1
MLGASVFTLKLFGLFPRSIGRKSKSVRSDPVDPVEPEIDRFDPRNSRDGASAAEPDLKSNELSALST